MKKVFTAITIITAIIASACWFTESNFNATYIASVNGSVVHYEEASTISNAVYHNGQSVDLPITVQVKVSDRFGDQQGESGGTKPIQQAILQYKVVKTDGTSGAWVTVKNIDNPNWAMNFDRPVNLFGNTGIIDPSDISTNDNIIIRIWLTDGIYSTGDIDSDIAVSEVPDTQTQSDVEIGDDGWAAPHVFRVKYSGKRRILI